MSRVLIVDDMPFHLDYLREEFENLGFDVTTAADGETCLRRIAERPPDIVLLDSAMPGMDGLEVIRMLRREEAYADLPVILLTARQNVEDRVAGLDAGADDYVTKPFHISEVVSRVRALLRVRDLQQRVIDRERRLAQIQGVGQTLVTLSHHLNNATQAISGLAQIADTTEDDPGLNRQLVDVCLRQTGRIRTVLQSLHDMVERMNLETVDYAGTPDAMLAIKELEQKLDLPDPESDK